MSDPQPLPGRKTPQRAEPLQPDAPGSGNQTGTDANADKTPPPHADDAAAASDVPHGPGGADKIRKQTTDALDNVREGYK